MSTHEKRLAAMRSNPRAVRFDQLRAALEYEGFKAQQGNGDHWKFIHPILPYPLVIDPRKPHVKAVYVKNALKAIQDLRDQVTE